MKDDDQARYGQPQSSAPLTHAATTVYYTRVELWNAIETYKREGGTERYNAIEAALREFVAAVRAGNRLTPAQIRERLSVSYLQRRFRLDYFNAMKLQDDLVHFDYHGVPPLSEASEKDGD